jgi:hypothetical protein
MNLNRLTDKLVVRSIQLEISSPSLPAYNMHERLRPLDHARYHGPKPERVGRLDSHFRSSCR